MDIRNNGRRSWQFPNCKKWQTVRKIYEPGERVRMCSRCYTRVLIRMVSRQKTEYVIDSVTLAEKK